MFIHSSRSSHVYIAALYAVACAVVLLCGAHIAHAQTANPISSPEFSDETSWYNTMNATFRWDLDAAVEAVAVEIVDTLEGEPLYIYEPPVRQYVVDSDELTEGVQYLAVQFKEAGEWGDIYYHTIQLDFTSPQNLWLDMTTDSEADTATLYFSADDTLSGIMGYAVYIADRKPVFVTPEQAQNGYQFSRSSEGVYDIMVVAFDRAGNSRSNRFPVFVVPKAPESETLIMGVITRDGLILTTLLVLVLGLAWYAFATRRMYVRKISRLRSETREVQTEMGKVFAALRDEISDQIEGLRSKSRITKGEQQVVENLTRVLNVSETLIQKEINDVQKILK